MEAVDLRPFGATGNGPAINCRIVVGGIIKAKTFSCFLRPISASVFQGGLRRKLRLARIPGYFLMVILIMRTGSTGTLLIIPFLAVLTSEMASTTSIPLATLPKTV